MCEIWNKICFSAEFLREHTHINTDILLTEKNEKAIMQSTEMFYENACAILKADITGITIKMSTLRKMRL